MGIINITPDSFSQDGCLLRNGDYVDHAVNLALRLIKEGADMIDLGGESSRPGAKRISTAEELRRVIPVLKILIKKTNIPISVDTYKPAVAKEALEEGASIINNIKGTQTSHDLLKMIKRKNAAIILMHTRGSPHSMQKNTHYDNLMEEIIVLLKKSLEKCLEIGINSDRIVLDPGIGFAKTSEQNLEIINRLDQLAVLNQPILIGTSRKSFIGKILNKPVDQRLLGTIASVCVSVLNGAHIVRVHDVKETKEALKVVDAIVNSSIREG